MLLISGVLDMLPRQEERFATFAAVEIMSEAGALLGQGTLRDISVSGGFVRTAAASVFPDRFAVHIAKLGRTVTATVRRRNSDGLGIRFENQVDLDAFTARQDARVRQIAGYFTPARTAA
ncbi:MAG TPA: PilZ domain-containing protein [Afifellaceae bacterium]|nr:PilZ domain-containing protein [Afifellaceae bacterium]